MTLAPLLLVIPQVDPSLLCAELSMGFRCLAGRTGLFCGSATAREIGVTSPKKVWEIDVPLPFPFGSAHIRREAPAPPPPPMQPVIGGGDKGRPKKPKRTYEEDPGAQMHSRWHIVFAYVLGPLYPLLTRWNPSNIAW